MLSVYFHNLAFILCGNDIDGRVTHHVILHSCTLYHCDYVHPA